MREEILFCEPTVTNTTDKNIFNIINNCLRNSNITWGKYVGMCTDGARTMSAGAYTGLQGFIRKVATEARWIYCIIHRETLAEKGMGSELEDALHVFVKTVNLIKVQPLKSRVFKILCEDMGSEHTTFISYTETRWLSRRKGLTRIFEMKNEVFTFLPNEKHPNSELFWDTSFPLNLANMVDIFRN